MDSIVLPFSDATTIWFNLKPRQSSNTETPNMLIDDIDVQWDETFAKSLDLLERLADEALADYREDRTEVLIPDEL